MFADPLVNTLARFVAEVGIEVAAASSSSKTLFPGLDIQNGCVLIDESRLVHPGDILHEAGHVAVTDPMVRSAERLTPTGGQELAALAWSYAAALHLRLHPRIVFYEESYGNGGEALLENFAEGRYIGVPLLRRYRMTLEPTRMAAGDTMPYPHMLRWLRA
jgi:hypothetical protein